MLHSAEREKRRAQTKSKSGSRRRELIIRPAGKAGCDWNLCERMGLVDNKQEYNRIRRTVHDCATKWLDKTQRISAQDDLAICRVIRFVNNEFPEFKIFHNGWPVREMIRQYLSNRVSYEKKRQLDLLATLDEQREREHLYENEKFQKRVHDAYRNYSERPHREREIFDESEDSNHNRGTALIKFNKTSGHSKKLQREREICDESDDSDYDRGAALIKSNKTSGHSKRLQREREIFDESSDSDHSRGATFTKSNKTGGRGPREARKVEEREAQRREAKEGARRTKEEGEGAQKEGEWLWLLFIRDD
ncbi:hypothetical protein AX14_008648 [Amanita brunnescens Koide BX004]|nr:hypothetical protein AX14_008648 [Amanita brunnescens Koide BX004]